MIISRNIINQVIHHLKVLFYWIYGLIAAIIFCTLFLIFRPCNPKNFWWFQVYLPAAYLIGVRYKIRGREDMDRRVNGGIVVCNHQNALDIFALINLAKRFPRMIFLAKYKYYIYPHLGLLCWLSGVIRTGTSDGYSRILEIVKKYMENGNFKVMIYPEGTRNVEISKTRTLLPFRKGAFAMAIECQVPIIPVVHSPYHFYKNLDGEYYFGRGEVISEIMEPIETTGLTSSDVNDLMKRTYDIMQAKYDQLVDEIDRLHPEAGVKVKK